MYIYIYIYIYINLSFRVEPYSEVDRPACPIATRHATAQVPEPRAETSTVEKACDAGVCEQKQSSREEHPFEDRLLEHQIRVWIAVSVAVSKSRGLCKRNDSFTDNGVERLTDMYVNLSSKMLCSTVVHYTLRVGKCIMPPALWAIELQGISRRICDKRV